MALPWQPIDLCEDPDEPRFVGDPAELVDAMAELLELSARAPSWHRHAACRGRGHLVPFFPERGQSTEPAKDVCAGCAVAAECLEAGMSEHFGIWGGQSERQRRATRREAA